jgi:NAD(P)-dependent dehydrogenase (short-subunit alcohol dehydrogenase family)
MESILDMTTELFDWTMKTNLYTPFWIIRAAVPHLKRGSAIIVTISEQAYDPVANLYDYAQTKAATMNFVKSLGKQLGPKGIGVNGVAPGPIYTPLQISAGTTEEHWRNFGGNTRRAAAVSLPSSPPFTSSLPLRMPYTTGNIYGAGGGMGQP